MLSTYVKTDNYEFNADIRNQQLSKIIQSNIYDIEEAEELASQIVNKSMRDFQFDNEVFLAIFGLQKDLKNWRA